VITDRNIFPWGTNHSTRWSLRNEQQGEFLGNFKRGGGDNMGIAGALNDNADYTAPVYSYKPNAFGLYNMAGNVSEWTMDTYRPVTRELDDHNPYRGNYYETFRRQAEDNSLEDKDSTGHLTRRPMTSEEIYNPLRVQANSPDQRGFADGDTTSQVSYDYGRGSLLNNETKVIKGGSWADRAYYMSPGTRRFIPASEGSATIGFRCVMDRLGSSNGNNREQSGNYFGGRKKK
jgi:sulfatase modifying factor 1